MVAQRHREHEMPFQPAAPSSSVADAARPSAGHVAVDAEWTGDGKFSQSVSQISCRSRNSRNAKWSWRFAEPLKKFRNFNSSERFAAEIATSYIAQNAEISSSSETRLRVCMTIPYHKCYNDIVDILLDC